MHWCDDTYTATCWSDPVLKEYDYEGYKKWEQINKSSDPKYGRFYLNNDSGELDDIFKSIAAKIQLRLVR